MPDFLVSQVHNREYIPIQLVFHRLEFHPKIDQDILATVIVLGIYKVRQSSSCIDFRIALLH